MIPDMDFGIYHTKLCAGGAIHFTWLVRLTAGAVLAAGCLAGCSESPSGRPDDRPPVRIASYDFTENQILAELYGQALRRAGVPVQIEAGLGTREIVEPALEQG